MRGGQGASLAGELQGLRRGCANEAVVTTLAEQIRKASPAGVGEAADRFFSDPDASAGFEPLHEIFAQRLPRPELEKFVKSVLVQPHGRNSFEAVLEVLNRATEDPTGRTPAIAALARHRIFQPDERWEIIDSGKIVVTDNRAEARRGWTETATGDWTRSSMGLGTERIKRTVATFLDERAAAS
jgi:hypothetical protein